MSYDYTTTTASNFPVRDVTHKPKRMQGDAIRLRNSELGVSNDKNNASNNSEPLAVITLERAISYYKRMSADEVNGKLYSATAKWLEELLVSRIPTPKTKPEVSISEEGVINADTEKE